MRARALVVIAPVLIAACATPVYLPPSPPGAEEPVTTPPDTPESGTADVTAALIVEAETLLATGRTDAAVNVLERAIRIVPSNGKAWLALAEVELTRREFARAEQYARKAMLFLPSGAQARAWLAVAQARDGQGDVEEASRIRKTWGFR